MRDTDLMPARAGADLLCDRGYERSAAAVRAACDELERLRGELRELKAINADLEARCGRQCEALSRRAERGEGF